MASVIVDASLAIKWVLDEERSIDAIALLERWQIGRIKVHVPSWFSCEIANILFQATRIQRMTMDQAIESLSVIESYVTVLDADPDLGARAIHIALETGQKATYDSYYVALAEHCGYDLWTADFRHWQAVYATYPFVNWLGDDPFVAEPGAGQ